MLEQVSVFVDLRNALLPRLNGICDDGREETRRGMGQGIGESGTGQRRREPVGLLEGSWPLPSVCVTGPDFVMAQSRATMRRMMTSNAMMITVVEITTLDWPPANASST